MHQRNHRVEHLASLYHCSHDSLTGTGKVYVVRNDGLVKVGTIPENDYRLYSDSHPIAPALDRSFGKFPVADDSGSVAYLNQKAHVKKLLTAIYEEYERATGEVSPPILLSMLDRCLHTLGKLFKDPLSKILRQLPFTGIKESAIQLVDKFKECGRIEAVIVVIVIETLESVIAPTVFLLKDQPEWAALSVLMHTELVTIPLYLFFIRPTALRLWTGVRGAIALLKRLLLPRPQ